MIYYKFILIVLLKLIVLSVSGQYDYLRNVHLNKNQLTEDDTILIVYDYWFPYTPCRRDSVKEFSSSSKIINIDAYYAVGDGASPCDGTDTVYIGSLSPNEYHILFSIHNLLSDYHDTDTIEFKVEGDIVGEDTPVQNQISIYPNPASGYIIIDGIPRDGIIEIYDFYGRQMLKYKHSINRYYDTGQLSSGIYVLKIFSKGSLFHQRKISIYN